MIEQQSEWSLVRMVQSWLGQGPVANPAATTLTSVRPEEPSLVAHALTRSFGTGEQRSYALREAAIRLFPGELSLLMGPSGSGKSTLLAVISALLRPDSGTVHAAGQDLWSLDEDELEQFRLKHCSYIFQGYNLFPALSARQQLEVVLRWGEGVSLREAQDRADLVLAQLGLSKKAHLRPQALSGGEKQRVAIARALVKNPTFIFADEPTSALDWENGQQVIRLLQACAQERKATVLVVTHDHRLVPFADRVFEMADGQLEREIPRSDTEDFLLELTATELDVPRSNPRLCLSEPGYSPA